MSKTKRTIIFLIALLFLVTSVAFSVFVFIDMGNGNDAADTAALQEELDRLQQQQQTCDISVPVPADPQPVPETFVAEGDVTELKTETLEAGQGDAAAPGDCLVVKYHGTMAETGEKFDGNFDQPTALQFTVGAGMVIPGWDQGLQGMKVGETRRIIIPSELGYGEAGNSAIPPNTDLVFVVKLLEIKQS